ncbi:hypothetical protein QQ045_005185 [Rhodiola kirilowii]
MFMFRLIHRAVPTDEAIRKLGIPIYLQVPLLRRPLRERQTPLSSQVSAPFTCCLEVVKPAALLVSSRSGSLKIVPRTSPTALSRVMVSGAFGICAIRRDMEKGSSLFWRTFVDGPTSYPNPMPFDYKPSHAMNLSLRTLNTRYRGVLLV